jgi:hypothetical protein
VYSRRRSWSLSAIVPLTDDAGFFRRGACCRFGRRAAVLPALPLLVRRTRLLSGSGDARIVVSGSVGLGFSGVIDPGAALEGLATGPTNAARPIPSARPPPHGWPPHRP